MDNCWIFISKDEYYLPSVYTVSVFQLISADACCEVLLIYCGVVCTSVCTSVKINQPNKGSDD